MNDDVENKHKFDIKVPNTGLLKSTNVKISSTKSEKPLRQQISKGVASEKVKTKESKFLKFARPFIFSLLNLSINFIQWLLLHVIYLVSFVIVYHSTKLLKIKNQRINDILTNFISYGWIIIWLIIFFITYFYHSLFFIFYLNSSSFANVHFSYIFTYKTLNQLSFSLGYGLLIAGTLTIIANGYSLFIFRQSFGQIFMQRQLINKNDKRITRKKILIYMFIHLIICATFFVWPIFLSIILLSLIYYGIFRRNWIMDLVSVKVRKNVRSKSNLLTRFLELFTFYYSRKAEFSLSEVQSTTKSSTQKNKGTTESPTDKVTEMTGVKINAKHSVALSSSSNSFKKINFNAQSSTFAPSKIKNTSSVRKIKNKIVQQNNGLSSIISPFINFWVYLLAFFLSFSTFGIWSALRKAHIVGGFFKLFFFRITSASFTTIFNNQILSRLYLFRDEHGNIINTLNGWHESLQFSKNNINYLISFIPHATSWHDIWNNIEFIVAFLVINFKYNPAITAAWLLLFFIAFWFFLNVIFIVLSGNTFVGFCLSPRKIRLVHCSTNQSVSMIERLIYAFFYVTFAFLYIVPILNLIWIAANIGFFLYYRETLLNRIAGYKYGIAINNFKSDLLQSVESTNSILLWIRAKFYKELFTKDRI